MPRQRLPIEDICEAAPMTEPLATLKENIMALQILTAEWTTEIKNKKKEAKKDLKAIRKSVESSREHMEVVTRFINACKDLLRDARRSIKKSNLSEEGRNRLQKIIEDRATDIKESRKVLRQSSAQLKKGEELTEIISVFTDAYTTQSLLFLPMAFVYLVCIWDAFIMDTARKILLVHPHLISESDGDAKLSKASIWKLNSMDNLRSHLIEREVRKLDEDREALADCFKDYWGIDWTESKVPLEKIVEIRARRDIWVHNRGIVNQQYLDMVQENSPFELGQKADMTKDYFNTSLYLLIGLAVYVHKVADAKHYSKSTSS